VAVGTIFTVLANVPWGQVIDAAPKVADGATRLWNSVTRRKADDSPGIRIVSTEEAESARGENPISALQGQVASLQSDVAQLKNEMETASELIKALADQNAALVTRIELNRKRVYRQTLAGVLVAALLLAAVVYFALRNDG
jgi:chromosome segregation ATPase